MSSIDSGMKLLLALLYAAGESGKENEKIRGFTRLEKLIFLLQKEAGFPEFYKFEAYNYGPWSGDVHDDLETLADAGIIKVEKENPKFYAEISDAEECISHETIDDAPTEVSGVEIYSLTDSGLKAAKKIFNSLSDEEKKNIIYIKKKFNKMPLIDLLRYIYTRHDEYAKASKIKDKILKPSYFGRRPMLSDIERD